MSRAGSIKRDASGKWMVVVDLAAPGATQRRQVKRRGFATKDDAQDALDEIKKTIRSGNWVEPSKLTLGEYLTEWLDGLAVKGRRPSTIDSYRRAVKAYVIGQDLGDVPLQGLTALDLDRRYSELVTKGGKKAQGLSLRTVRYLHVIIGKALKDAEDKGLVPRNVARKASPPSASSTRAPEFTAWTPTELRTFLDHIAGTTHAPMWRFMAMSGARRGEACGLRWADLDLDDGTVSIRQTVVALRGEPLAIGDVKTKRSRRKFDLDPQTIAVLRAHRKTQREQRMLLGAGYVDQGLVFTMPTGAPWHPDTISQAFERLAAAAPVTKIRLHDLRHTHASHLLAASVNAKVVSDRLGHASVAFTLDTYAHVMPGQQAEAAAAVAALVDC